MFGSVVAIIRARDEDDAPAIADDTAYGLSRAVITETPSAASGSPCASRPA